MKVTDKLHDPTDTHWVVGWVDLRAGLDAVERRKISCLCHIYMVTYNL
jgi:hypothetical protein